MQTTVVGSYPKPDYLQSSSWFDQDITFYDSAQVVSADSSKLVETAQRQVIQEQLGLGIDIPTDGEVSRENYIFYCCRNLQGIDFENVQEKSTRNGQCLLKVPTITGPLSLKVTGYAAQDWRAIQDLSPGCPIKYTLPGPATILDTLYNLYYPDAEIARNALVKILASEIRALADAGCRYIQIDEPVLARYPEQALEYMIKDLEECFVDIESAERIVHICRGYPNYLDQENYHKAPPNAYPKIIPALDRSPYIDTISIEDAEQHNSLDLFKLFQNSKLVLGVIKIARSEVETVEEIRDRIVQVQNSLPPGTELSISPDCGLGMLPHHVCQRKLQNMLAACAAIACKTPY